MKLEIKKDVLKVLTEAEMDLFAGGATTWQDGCTSNNQACNTGTNSPNGGTWLPCTNGCAPGSTDPVYCTANCGS
jgi:hypothetical protein